MLKKILMFIGAIAVISAIASGMGGEDAADANDEATTATTESGENAEVEAVADEKSAKKEQELTPGQENALRAGQNYVDMMGFSKKGLIGQLSSSYGDGYARKDAVFAANHVDVDWNAEAAEAAKNYLDTMPFSRTELIQQLESSAGDKFTHAQAVYGAQQAY
jgi:hypothetical protein